MSKSTGARKTWIIVAALVGVAAYVYLSTPTINEQPLPEVVAQNFHEDEVNYILNFTASWCQACQKEHKYVQDIAKIYDIKIYAVLVNDDMVNMDTFLEANGNPYTKVFADWPITRADNRGIEAIPELIVVRHNKMVYKGYGMNAYIMQHELIPLLDVMHVESKEEDGSTIAD